MSLLEPMEGYLHPLYAQSFSDIGVPVYLPRCRGWLIQRSIPGTTFSDAMGPYPLFFCEDWAALIADLETLRDELVSLTLVLSPLSPFPLPAFQDYFDICQPYKDHYLLDLSRPLAQTISKNRRKLARRALRTLAVELRLTPEIDVDEWAGLYACLVERHAIQGIRAFSRQSFAGQLAIPRTHYFRVTQHGKLVGGNLFYLQGEAAYAHLSAFTAEGYAAGAPYAVKWVALQYLEKNVRWLNLGGGTSHNQDEAGGLDAFKRGWSSQTGKSTFCGKIFQPQLYATLAARRAPSDLAWFPAYRAGDY